MTTSVQLNTPPTFEKPLDQDTTTMTLDLGKISDAFQEKQRNIAVLTEKLKGARSDKSQIASGVQIYKILNNTKNPILFAAYSIYYTVVSPISTYNAYQLGEQGVREFDELEGTIEDTECQLECAEKTAESLQPTIRKSWEDDFDPEIEESAYFTIFLPS